MISFYDIVTVVKRVYCLTTTALQVCLSTVGTLGDVARNVEGDLLPYCDEIM